MWSFPWGRTNIAHFLSAERNPCSFASLQRFVRLRTNRQGGKLSDDFDAKILAQIEKPEVKARRVPLTIRMRPLYKAAAIVAITLSLGTAAQRSFNKEMENDYNYETYKDTYTDPQVAYG